jgi:hypothetical protein
LPVLGNFSAKNNVIAIRAENLDQRSRVELLGCGHQGIDGLLRSIKGSGA